MKKMIVIGVSSMMVIMGISVCLAANKGNCEARPNYEHDTCKPAATGGCTGGCYKIVWHGCNDCNEGDNDCPDPTSSCTSHTSSDICIIENQAGCACSKTHWKDGKEEPANQVCN